MRLLGVVAVSVATLGHAPEPVAGQLSVPCELSCGAVLGASALGVGMGALVVWARQTGGVSTQKEAFLVMGGGMTLAVGGAIALEGNGRRQERAVYGSGLGMLGGAVAGLGIAALVAEIDAPRAYSAALIGAGAGALVGGLVGALTYEESIFDGAARLGTVPLFAGRLSF